jgi:hypothetical protein
MAILFGVTILIRRPKNHFIWRHNTNDHLSSDHGRLAKGDLELPRCATALRHGLHVGGCGPCQWALALELGRRAMTHGTVVDALC